MNATSLKHYQRCKPDPNPGAIRRTSRPPPIEAFDRKTDAARRKQTFGGAAPASPGLRRATVHTVALFF